MSGSFWKFSNGFSSMSNISTLLDNYNNNKENGDDSKDTKYKVLIKLLDENDLLQELLSNNSILLEFLRDDDILDILFDMVINEGVTEDLSKEMNELSLAEQDKEKGNSEDNDDLKEEEEKKGEEKNKKDDENKVISDQDEHNKTNTNKNDDDSSSSDSDSDSDEDNDKKGDSDDAKNDDSFDQLSQSGDESEDETDEERRSKHATLATEILSADVWSLTDTVMESTHNLNKLWAVLDTKDPLSINLSTYFMRIMEHLLDMKCDEMINYLIDSQSRLVEKFMNHLSNPPLMDFLLKLISTDKPDNSTGIIDFLQGQTLIPLLIRALDPDDDGFVDNDIALIRQSSAADLLKALITISANSTTDNSTIGPNELTRELVSLECMQTLCDIMLKGGYALANGVGIIIEIIRKNNSDYDILPVLYITLESHPPTGRDPIYLGHLLRVFSDKITDISNLLSSERESQVTPNNLKTPFGEIEPLGFERFKICELIAELLHCSNMALLNDNKGYDVVKERDELRNKMKEYDPISFKYNEVILLPNEEKYDEEREEENDDKNVNDTTRDGDSDNDQGFGQGDNDNDNDNHDHEFVNDTIDSFNSKDDNEDSLLHNSNYDPDIEEPHENANLSEEQLRRNPVIGDVWKIALFDTQIVTNIVLMFFKFPWNNFLHNVVFDIVQQVLNGSMDIGFNKFLAIDLFDRGNITQKIIEGQHLCSQYENDNNGLRLGYMGHLTLIAEEVVKFIQSYPTNTLSELIDEKISGEDWEDYVSNVLYDTREKYNAILGGGDEDDEEEDDNISNTFDEGSGEVIEESGYKSGFLFDNGHSDADKETYEHYDDSDAKSPKNISDESESDDDDHFTKYMSQELVNTASSEVSNTGGSKTSDEEDLSSDEETISPTEVKKMDLDLQTNDDSEDYEDPNDDGQSYKKFNPLYDDSGSLVNEKEDIEDLSSDSASSSSSEEEEEEEAVEEDSSFVNKKDKEGAKLTRAASQS